MRVTLAVLVFGLVFAATAAARTVSGTGGLTTTRLTCNTFLDGDGKMVGQPVGFYFQAVNSGAGRQVVNLRFAVPARFQPSAEPTILISSPMAIGDPVAPDVCLAPSTGLSDASKAHCNPDRSAYAGLKNWVCPNVPMPAGRWRWLAFKVAFAKPGNRWTRFWATGTGLQTKSDLIPTGL